MHDKGFQWQKGAAVCKKYTSTKQGCLPLLASASVIVDRAVNIESLGCLLGFCISARASPSKCWSASIYKAVKALRGLFFFFPPRQTGNGLAQKDSSWQIDVLYSLGQTWGEQLCDCQPQVCHKPSAHSPRTWGYQQSNVAPLLSPYAVIDVPVEQEGTRAWKARPLLTAEIMHWKNLQSTISTTSRVCPTSVLRDSIWCFVNFTLVLLSLHKIFVQVCLQASCPEVMRTMKSLSLSLAEASINCSIGFPCTLSRGHSDL